MVLKDDFADLLPPLSTEEFEALKADIKQHGVLHPVCVDEDGKILDGRHRLKIDPDAPKRVIKGLSSAEKEAFVFRANFVRRNLSPAQKDEARRRMKETAKRLREEDAKKWTQKRVAEVLGVDQTTVSYWFAKGTTNTNVRNGSKASICKRCGAPSSGDGHRCVKPQPDARVKINPSKKPEIAAAVKAGKPQAQVAADIGVSQQAVSKIVREEAKKAEIKQQRAESAKKREGNCGVILGDFRIGSSAIDDESIDLIFTDPPYDEEAAAIYQDIATLAASKLVKGGWLCAYTGHAHLPAVMKAFSETPGLTYAWTFCVVHSGGDLRFRKFKLQNGWKPIVAAFKPPLQVDWEWFKDVVSGGKEKSDHPWQQAESEASHFIERLCPKYGLVFDPCCGSGTSLVAAKTLDRKWLGYELNKEHVESARARIEEVKQG